jgi:organic radical activating enzyme
MYDRVIELELSSLCNAKCSDCMRTRLDNENKFYEKRNLTFDEIENWLSQLNLSRSKIKLCGVLGDPMINPQLEEILFFLLFEKNIKDIEMSTNGGTRSLTFWKNLGLLSKNSDGRFVVHWSVDGATRNDYRENVSLDRVWNNIRAYHSTGGHSIWQYIIFDYNEDEVDIARQMAKENRMKFFTRKSWRNTSSENKFQSKQSKSIDSDSHFDVYKRAYFGKYETPNIKCRHKIKNEIFIGANGRVWPCCHLYDEHVKDGHKSIRHLLDVQGQEFNSLYTHDLLEILNGEWYQHVLEDSWNKEHDLNLPRCYMACGDHGKREVIKSDKTET